jgi:hypothetical protein
MCQTYGGGKIQNADPKPTKPLHELQATNCRKLRAQLGNQDGAMAKICWHITLTFNMFKI